MPDIRRFTFKTLYRGPEPHNFHLIIAGLLLGCGALLSIKMPVGGSLICDEGTCYQTQYAVFGTATNSMTYDASQITGFDVQASPNNARRTRAVTNLSGQIHPLTAGYGSDTREIERIAREGSRFIETDRSERLTLRYEQRALIQLISLLLLLTGSCYSGWLLSQRYFQNR